MTREPVWEDATLEAFFQTALVGHERQGGLAALLDEVFPIRFGGNATLDLASFDAVAVDGAVELAFVVRVVLWTAESQIDEILEQEVGVLTLPYRDRHGGFAHDGIPLVTTPSAIVERVRRYVDGLREVVIARWHAWLHADARAPHGLFPQPA